MAVALTVSARTTPHLDLMVHVSPAAENHVSIAVPHEVDEAILQLSCGDQCPNLQVPTGSTQAVP